MNNPTTTASLHIHVYVDCPHCENPIDLLDSSDTNNENHNEEGWIITQAIGDDYWDKHHHFSAEDVTCSKCLETFNVEGLDW